MKTGVVQIKRKASKPFEALVLALVFFTIMPLVSALRHGLGLPGAMAALISVVLFFGIVMFFYKQITAVNKIIVKVIFLKFLKEFVFLVFLFYNFVISIFASIYYLIAFVGESNGSYFKWYYFSIITLTTVGYGDITPTSTLMKLFVSLESFLGYISPSILFTVGLGLILNENRN